MKIKCKFCGYEMEDTDEKCPYCGTPLESTSQAETLVLYDADSKTGWFRKWRNKAIRTQVIIFSIAAVFVILDIIFANMGGKVGSIGIAVISIFVIIFVIFGIAAKKQIKVACKNYGKSGICVYRGYTKAVLIVDDKVVNTVEFNAERSNQGHFRYADLHGHIDEYNVEVKAHINSKGEITVKIEL